MKKTDHQSRDNKKSANDQIEKQNKTCPTNDRIKWFLILHFAVFILSLGSLCSKKASSFGFLSPGFTLLYGGVILALFVYALIWQQVLKRMPLVVAFVNKVAILFWSFLYGVLIFHEEIHIKSIVGMLIVALGVVMIVSKTTPSTGSEDNNE